jgi:hypothetical protein
MRTKISRKLPFYAGLTFGILLLGLTGTELITMPSAVALAGKDSKLEREWTFNVHKKISASC